LFSFYRKDATPQRLDFISFLFTAKTLRRKGLTLFLFFLPQRRYAAKVCFYFFLFTAKMLSRKDLLLLFSFARKDANSQRFDFISFLLPQRRYVAKVY
jgi:hypothetical protein